jgi:hypothetical protein
MFQSKKYSRAANRANDGMRLAFQGLTHYGQITGE